MSARQLTVSWIVLLCVLVVLCAGRTVYKPLGAPTEVSLLTLGQKAGLQQEVLTKSKPRIGAIPFESEHKVCVCWLVDIVLGGGR